MKVAQNCQESYTDKRCRPLEFEVGDQVFLKVSPTKGITKFGMVAKFNSRYIDPYQFLKELEK